MLSQCYSRTPSASASPITYNRSIKAITRQFVLTFVPSNEIWRKFIKGKFSILATIRKCYTAGTI